MNSTQWRGKGYKTIFRQGKIYLFRPLSNVLISTEVNHGLWMRQDNVNQRPWKTHAKGLDGEPADFREDVLNTLAACYCGYGVLCDFCAGRRGSPVREKIQPHPMSQRAKVCVGFMNDSERHGLRFGLIPAWCSAEQLGGKDPASTWPLLTDGNDVKNLALALFDRIRQYDETGV